MSQHIVQNLTQAADKMNTLQNRSLCQDNSGDGAHKMFLLRKAPTFDPPLSPLVHPYSQTT